MSLRQAVHTITIQTEGKALVPFTNDLSAWVTAQRITTGLLTVWCRHTSASLAVQENASPAVHRDILNFFAHLVPEDASYEHDDEGADDMPAHLRAMLTTTQLSIPVSAGQLTLGTWQGVYLFEHRRAHHRREIVLHLLGE